ncbi:DUF2207 domain-containing protein [Candidatus Saccharibacteria bacterium]|nr:DUF2207 domain-containing protein [Candidatus Saccharibacteria bacterium]
MPSKLLVALTAVITSLIGALIIAAPVSANVQNFHFSEFRAIYRLNATESGTTLDVHELLVAEFPNRNQNKGIVREIPRTNQDGQNVVLQDLRIGILRNGQPEPIWEIQRRGGGQWFEVSTGTDAYLRGTQRFELSYQFQNVITDFGTHQELYWDTNGTAWQQRFDRLSATVFLPAQAMGGFTNETRCFVGVHGSTNTADCLTEIHPSDGYVTFTSRRPLQPGENLTFVLAFESDTFVVPAPYRHTTYSPIIVAASIAGLNGLFFVVIFILYRKRVAAPKKLHKPAFTPPQYLPPKDLSLAAAATLTSKAKGSTVAAQLLDMAVRHKVKLIEQPPDQSKGRIMRALAATKYSVEIQSVTKLLPDDRELLQIISGDSVLADGQVIDLSPSMTARSSMSTKLQNYSKKSVFKRLAEQGIVRDKRPKLLGVLGTLHLFAGFFSAAIGFAVIDGATADLYNIALPVATWILVFSNIGLGIISIAFAGFEHKYAHLLQPGWEKESYLRGFYEYIKLAEKERLEFLQSVKGAGRVNISDNKAMVNLYEKALPYAVLFGLESSWTKELMAHAGDSYHPTWFVGVAAFNMSTFSTSLTSFSSSMTANYGAGSSGSSGMSGGASGGGGGGGGGGGR